MANRCEAGVAVPSTFRIRAHTHPAVRYGAAGWVCFGNIILINPVNIKINHNHIVKKIQYESFISRNNNIRIFINYYLCPSSDTKACFSILSNTKLPVGICLI